MVFRLTCFHLFFNAVKFSSYLFKVWMAYDETINKHFPLLEWFSALPVQKAKTNMIISGNTNIFSLCSISGHRTGSLMLSWQPSPHRLHACKLLLRCKSSLNKAKLTLKWHVNFQGGGQCYQGFFPYSVYWKSLLTCFVLYIDFYFVQKTKGKL